MRTHLPSLNYYSTSHSSSSSSSSSVSSYTNSLSGFHSLVAPVSIVSMSNTYHNQSYIPSSSASSSLSSSSSSSTPSYIPPPINVARERSVSVPLQTNSSTNNSSNNIPTAVNNVNTEVVVVDTSRPATRVRSMPHLSSHATTIHHSDIISPHAISSPVQIPTNRYGHVSSSSTSSSSTSSFRRDRDAPYATRKTNYHSHSFIQIKQAFIEEIDEEVEGEGGIDGIYDDSEYSISENEYQHMQMKHPIQYNHHHHHRFGSTTTTISTHTSRSSSSSQLSQVSSLSTSDIDRSPSPSSYNHHDTNTYNNQYALPFLCDEDFSAEQDQQHVSGTYTYIQLHYIQTIADSNWI